MGVLSFFIPNIHKRIMNSEQDNMKSNLVEE